MGIGTPLVHLPGARQRVFTTDREGHRWALMKVQGMQGEWTEDLSDRLIDAAQEQIVEDAKEVLEGGLEKAKELLEGLF